MQAPQPTTTFGLALHIASKCTACMPGLQRVTG